MKKSVRNGIGLVGIMTLVLFGGVMTSYAIGPGEVSHTVAKPATYNQQSVRALGSWEQQGSVWKFKCSDRSYLSNAWLESLTEPGAFYYVDNNGNMIVNATTPDGYQVDVNGLWRSGVEVQESESSNENSVTTSRYKDPKKLEVSEEFLKDLAEHDLGVGNYGSLH